MCELPTDEQLAVSSRLHQQYVTTFGIDPLSPLMQLLRVVVCSADDPRDVIDQFYRDELNRTS